MTTNYREVPEIYDYIFLVESGKYRVCDEQKQLISFIKKVFFEEKLIINVELLANYMSLQKYFDFDLFEWEKFLFTLHNCVFREDGMPRFPDLFIFVARGTGKNGYIAFEDFSLVGPYNPIRNYDIDICATSEEQAQTSFNDVYEILEKKENRKKLKKHFYWNKQVIVGLKNNSRLKYRTNNAKTKDGLRSGKVDFDEVHAYVDYDSIKVFTTALGKKPHPRRTYASTNGDICDGVLDDLISKSNKILHGEVPDNGMLPFICRIPKKEMIHDEANWYMANPSLQYMPNLLEETRKEYIDYCENPEANSDFMTKRMNLRETSKKEISITDWENIVATNHGIEDMILEGKTAVAGIDYTKINDFASAGVLFKVDGKYVWRQHSWLCTNSADYHRINKDLIKKAVAQGDLTLVDELEIAPEYITNWIQEKATEYNIIRIALDNYRYALLREAFKKIGIMYDPNKKIREQMLQLVRAGDKIKVEPIIDSAFTNNLIDYGDSALMRWYTNNTKKVKDKRYGNYEYQKIEEKSRKTDGFFAFVHAMTQVDQIPEEVQGLEDLPVFLF